MAVTTARVPGLVPRHKADVINHHFELLVSLADLSVEARERAAREGVRLIHQLKPTLQRAPEAVETGPWLEQCQKALAQSERKKSIIGIVGSTGAGKTSFINALLDEETLLPTNCMRACTATITEISFNKGSHKYRFVIEFLSRTDWQDELEKGFQVLLDSNGKIVKDATNEDSEAGAFYSKIRAVYSDLTRDAIERSTIRGLLEHPDVKVLDRTEDFEGDDPIKFADNLQRIIDSKDRTSRGPGKDLAYWPIIKRVNLYVKAKALMTGVTLVDLPGVQDSTPARAKIAQNYLKTCTGLIVTAPVHRAKDDRVAKDLLGPDFRRQVMMDGGYSTMTFACTKIDEINIREMSNTVGVIKTEIERLSHSIELKREEYEEIQFDLQAKQPQLAEAETALVQSNTKCDVYEDLARQSRGVLPSPEAQAKKRKFTEDGEEPGGKRQATEEQVKGTQQDEVMDDAANADEASMEEAVEQYSILDQQFQEVKQQRDEAKRRKDDLLSEVQHLKNRQKAIEDSISRTEDEKRSFCIKYRNNYVIKGIKEDFVAGVKECDKERAAYDEDWDPSSEARDYDKLAAELPVLTVSTRAYQKKMDRMKDEPDTPGFPTIEDTGIPAALRHCEQLTLAGRKKNADFLLAMMSKLLNTLNLWLANQLNTCKVSDMHREQARLTLRNALDNLKSSFTKLIQTTVNQVQDRLQTMIYKKMVHAKNTATKRAPTTVRNWQKFTHGTWKAICRREGTFLNENTQTDWNDQLLAPLLDALAPDWEACFNADMDKLFTDFAVRCRRKIKDFHAGVPDVLSSYGLNSRRMFGRLDSQHGGYKQALAEAEDAVTDYVSASARDINRAFKPQIARAMAPAYSFCVEQSGAGSFRRMQTHMAEYVSRHQAMFRDSTKHVQRELEKMLVGVRELLMGEVEKLHEEIMRDYLGTLTSKGNGGDGEGEQTDVTDLFVSQVALFLEGARGNFERPVEEQKRRVKKFGPILDGRAGRTPRLDEGTPHREAPASSSRNKFDSALAKSQPPPTPSRLFTPPNAARNEPTDEEADEHADIDTIPTQTQTRSYVEDSDEKDPFTHPRTDTPPRNTFASGSRSKSRAHGSFQDYANRQRDKYAGRASTPIKREADLEDEEPELDSDGEVVVGSVEGDGDGGDGSDGELGDETEGVGNGADGDVGDVASDGGRQAERIGEGAGRGGRRGVEVRDWADRGAVQMADDGEVGTQTNPAARASKHEGVGRGFGSVGFGERKTRRARGDGDGRGGARGREEDSMFYE